MAKLQNVSARISQEDAEFLSQLEIGGAKTASDKLRAIIEQARLNHSSINDYEASIRRMNELLAPINHHIRHFESNNEAHSELLFRVIEWLPDTLALIISTEQDKKETSAKTLSQLEASVADRIFRLIETVLQLSVSRQCGCYNTNLMQERIEPVLELSEIVKKKHVNN